MLRAVPSIIRTACFSSRAFKSFILARAISITCCAVTLPTLSRLGCADPLAKPAARYKSDDAGGLLVIKVNDRSW